MLIQVSPKWVTQSIKLPIIIGILSLILLLNGCALFRKSDNDLQTRSADELYETGQQAIENGQYRTAVRNLETLQTVYPFNEYAEQAHVQLIYAYYMDKDNDSTAASAQRFIRLYPRSEYIDYIFYMRGLANFYQDRGIFARVLPMDTSYRAPGSQREAYSDFEILINTYPNSPYAADARQRIVYLRNLMAERELHVADFYLQRHMYLAAANRASEIIENYPQTPQVEAALAIMIVANEKLGLQEDADDAIAVLELNYPDSTILNQMT